MNTSRLIHNFLLNAQMSTSRLEHNFLFNTQRNMSRQLFYFFKCLNKHIKVFRFSLDKHVQGFSFTSFHNCLDDQIRSNVLFYFVLSAIMLMTNNMTTFFFPFTCLDEHVQARNSLFTLISWMNMPLPSRFLYIKIVI